MVLPPAGPAGEECLTGVLAGNYNAFSNPLGSVQVRAVRDRSSGNYGDLHGYTVEGFSLPPGAEVLTVNWWDDYSFLGREAGMDGSVYSYTAPGSSEPYGAFYEASASGLQTGHWSRTLGEVRDSSTVGPAVMEAWYYDDHGRVVYHVKGYPSGRRIAERSGYDFVGNLTAVKRAMHDGTGTQEHTEEYAYTYDSWGRLQSTVHTLDGGSPVTLASNSYDSVGRLRGTQRGRVGTTPGPVALSSGYTYNVRGWLTGINGSLFSETLTYETPRSGSSLPGQWGGNISSSSWSIGDAAGDVSWYDYGYDPLGRLTDASYGCDFSNQDNYSRSYSYDLNGNMRTRTTPDFPIPLVENWQAESGNQSLLLAETVRNLNGTFPQSILRESYGYDAAGNRTDILNGSGDTLSVMRYNLLNLPAEYVSADGDMVNYVYSADGEKLYVEENPSGGTVQGTEYAANYRIENGTVTMIHTDAGYYTRVLTPAGVMGPLYTHIWYLKDHLGNNRLLADGSGAPVALHDYDPFGEEIATASSPQLYLLPAGAKNSPYKYGGKEWSATTSTYDFEARQFSPSFHRFTTMDPLAEKYYSISPYAYCADNPVNLVDPSGGIWFRPEQEARIRNTIQNRIAQVDKQISAYNEQLLDSTLDDDNKNSILTALNNAQSELIMLHQSLSDIDVLAKDDHYYVLSVVIDNDAHHVKQGKGGLISIEGNSEGLLVHEIRHISQSLENGGLQFNNGMLTNPGSRGRKGVARYEWHALMEVDAYKHQFAMDHSFPNPAIKSLQQITVSTVGAINNSKGEPVYREILEYAKWLDRIKSLQSE